MVGRTLAHYQITAAVGAGGMGEVFRATDAKLGREVALKILSAEMARDPDRLARFHREARAVAALNHPHIVTIFSVEEADGLHFLTMELVAGETLDHLIPQHGMAAEKIVEYATALADALTAAHEHGIIHRDLKPGNIMVTKDGRLKILDFGLAKDVRTIAANDLTVASASQTQAGMVMGTPAYMSPEQVTGRELDHRTDIFSLGVVLHEMATGSRPFAAHSSAELITAILRDAPPPVTTLRPDLSPELARILRRCMEKDPERRIQTARELAIELRDVLSTILSSTQAVASSMQMSRTVAVPADSGAMRAAEGFWVAVLPFKFADPEMAELAEGLSEEIVTGLSRFSYLRVIARASTLKFANQAVDLRSIGKELGARYVMEGSLRRAGTRLRVAVQLVDSTTGAHLWAETYERAYTAEAIFDLQDELTPRIVSTVADPYGVLPRSMAEVLRGKPREELTPHEAVLRAFGYFEHLTAEEHAVVRDILEHAVQRAPDHSDAWAMLCMLYRGEYAQGFNPLPNPLDRALAAGRRAVQLAPANHTAHSALASVLFFRRDLHAFPPEAERALALNPYDSSVLAWMGLLLATTGEWERGCALVDRGMAINPNHPGWYRFAGCLNAYRQGDYHLALELITRANMPYYFYAAALRAAALGELGEMDGAKQAVADVLAAKPDFVERAREEFEKWYKPDMVELLLAGLRKAGMRLAENEKPPAASPLSGATRATARADEGFWVAVLPFKSPSENADLTALAEGLTGDLSTGFSRFSFLHVIAPGSVARAAGQTSDVRTIGQELGARYAMEGAVRQFGKRVRLSVQITDTLSGAQIWAENFEREFQLDTIFELQDELASVVVGTAAGVQGVLLSSITESLHAKQPQELTPHEAFLRSLAYLQNVCAEEHAIAREALEYAVRAAPNYADAWTMLAIIYREEFNHGFPGEPDPLPRALSAARRAVALAPSSAIAHLALATISLLTKDMATFQSEARRAIELNPLGEYCHAYLGMAMAYSGDWKLGCAWSERARKINTRHPTWYWFTPAFDAYRRGDYPAALEFAVKAQTPGIWRTPMALAVVHARLGNQAAAQKALQSLLKVKPGFAEVARTELEKMFEPEIVEHLLESLRMAGMEWLETPRDEVQNHPAVNASHSGMMRSASPADESFWVAVLPFKSSSGNADLAALAEGLTDDIVTGMSRFPYLKVVARSSTARYAANTSGEHVAAQSAGQQLGARYVMEGNLRLAGSTLRLTVQLVDTESGAHVWAETYQRAFSADKVFELQDELVPRIVSTIADAHGVLPHTLSEKLRDKKPGEMSPLEAMLAGFRYSERLTTQEHKIATEAAERAVQIAPGYSYAWACVSLLAVDEYRAGFNPKPEPLRRAREAALRAVELDATNHRGYHSLARVHYCDGNFAAMRNAAEKAIALNPMDCCTLADLGSLYCYSGDWEGGCALVDKALGLNPHHPGWFFFPLIFDRYRKGEYQQALDYALKLNLPHFAWTHMALAAVYGQLGQKAEAQKALEQLKELVPDMTVLANSPLARDGAPGSTLLDGLRKAGLEIAA